MSAQNDPEQPVGAKDKHAEAHENELGALRNDLESGFQPVDEHEQNPGGSKNDTGLKTAAGRLVAVKLNVEPEQHDERNQKAGDDAQYGVFAHVGCSSSEASASLSFLRRLPRGATVCSHHSACPAARTT